MKGVGSSFDEFLKSEGIFEECDDAAKAKVIEMCCTDLDQFIAVLEGSISIIRDEKIAIKEKHRHASQNMQEHAKMLIDTAAKLADVLEPPKEDRGRHSDKPCKKCGEMQIYVTEINDYPDYGIKCYACGHYYCVDGPDA